MKAYTHIYTGNGKGKTTAAIGLAIRAAGHGLKTYFAQFMKGRYYGELTTLERIPEITVEQFGDDKCIHRDEVTQKHIDQAANGLLMAKKAMFSGRYNIIVLDEINVSIWFGLIDKYDVIEFLNNRPENIEIILTGRYAPHELIKYVDLVSEMNDIKHYYSDGVQARNGIER